MLQLSLDRDYFGEVMFREYVCTHATTEFLDLVLDEDVGEVFFGNKNAPSERGCELSCELCCQAAALPPTAVSLPSPSVRAFGVMPASELMKSLGMITVLLLAERHSSTSTSVPFSQRASSL